MARPLDPTAPYRISIHNMIRIREFAQKSTIEKIDPLRIEKESN